MKYLKFLIFAIFLFTSLHFSFTEVQAAGSSDAEEVTEEVQDNPVEDTSNEDESTEDIHTEEEAEKTESGDNGTESAVDEAEEKTDDAEVKEGVSEESTKEQEKESDQSESDKGNSEELDSQEEQEAERVTPFSTNNEEEDVATMPYKKGDRHEDIISIKEKLNAIGFDNISETDYFGNWMETRVKQLQVYYGLSETGEIDQTTLDQINVVFESPFQLGERHDDTIELKEKLNTLGYGHISVTTLYGDWTVNRVKKFQSDYGLKDHGIADSKTWDKLNELLSKTEFQVGDRHPDIVSIKEKLNAIGFDNIAETDYFGNWTKTRVEQFQSYYELSVTGTTNSETLEKLEEIYNSPFQLGKHHEDTIELKEKLNHLGYGHISVTTLYGDWTVNRVKKFQRENGLRDTGIADNKTWNKLNELLSATDFKVGDRHPNIISIKKQLNAIGFDNIAETDYFGNWTKTRVEQFQSYYGLSITGTTNTATIEKLDEIYNSPFQLGENHDNTIELKEKLNDLGYGHISVTTLYGDWTENRVKKFQSDYGLKAHGIADEKTWNKLNELHSQEEFKVGDRHPYLASLKAKLNFVGFDRIAETNYYGAWTETRVEQFQKYYGIPENGELDNTTIDKLNEVYNSPYQLGKSHPDMIEIKQMLNTLGYGHIEVTENFGDWTVNRVSKFQRDHDGLVENGIIDEVTLQKIYDLFEVYEEFDLTLEEALDKQMNLKNPAPQTDQTGYVDAQYTEITGELTGSSNIRSDASLENPEVATLPKGTQLTLLEQVEGQNLPTGNKWYKILYNNNVNYVHSNLVTNITAKTKVNLRVRAGINTESTIYTVLPSDTVVNVSNFNTNEDGETWISVRGYGWVDAHREIVSYYMDPKNNDSYQHLDLSVNLGLSSDQLNTFLNGRLTKSEHKDSVLRGQGKAFLEAASDEKTINELYLISHALLETAYGTSNLASGKIEVGEISNNKWVIFHPEDGTHTAELIEKKWIIEEKSNFNRNTAKNIKNTYNMFGIGAVDSAAEILGSVRAYREDWFSVEKAILGGANFIADDYIYNIYNQNTLYKMRWNPKAMEADSPTKGSPTKQYASDIAWAVKQVGNMKTMLSEVELLDNPLLKFNFINYK